MGSVWVAHHLLLDVTVAIKFMDPALAASSDGRSRFEREAQAAAKLKSPHVVQVHDFGLEDDTPYIVMELLTGEDLEARIVRTGRMSPKALSPLVAQVAKALRRAHEGGIVHRDLKPLNIFISRQDDEEVAKILDFGIAKAQRPTVGSSTKTGSLIGSPHYMSPEQARSAKQLDHRSDLWSLGVILFRAVAGRLPFPGEDLGDVLVAICADPIPIASSVAPDLGPAVDAFFERALQRDADKRFQSAREMAEAFAALAGDVAPIASIVPPKEDVPSSTPAPPPLVRPALVPPALVAPPLASTLLMAESPNDAALPAFMASPKQGEPARREADAEEERGDKAAPVPSKADAGTLSPAGNSIVRPPPAAKGKGRFVALAALAAAIAGVSIFVLRAPRGGAGAAPSAEIPSLTPAPSDGASSNVATSARAEANAVSAAPATTAPLMSASALLPAAPPPPIAPKPKGTSTPVDAGRSVASAAKPPSAATASPPPPPPAPAAPPKPNPPAHHDDGI